MSPRTFFLAGVQRYLVCLGIFLCLIVYSGCGSSSDNNSHETPKIGLSGVTQNFDGSKQSWDALLSGAEEAGVSFLHHQMPPWSEAEAQPGVFDFSYFSELLNDPRSSGYSLTLDIATPLGLNRVDHPRDISFVGFDDAVLINRYFKYVDAALRLFPSVRYVVLHTETVESFFADESTRNQKESFCSLISLTVRHIHTVFPEVKVGVYGTLNESIETLDCLNQDTDFFGAGYIADRGDAQHNSNIMNLLSRRGSKPVLLYEIGMPTSGILGGSEQHQVNFVRDLSKIVRELGPSLIGLSYYQHRDDSYPFVEQYIKAGFADFSPQQQRELIEFFSSLGLKRSDGIPKPAWTDFIELASLQR